MWSCLIASVEQEARPAENWESDGGDQLWCKGIPASAVVPQLIQHFALLSGTQQGLEAVTSPLQLSTRLSRFGRAGCTHPLLVSADDIRQVVRTEAGEGVHSG